MVQLKQNLKRMIHFFSVELVENVASEYPPPPPLCLTGNFRTPQVMMLSMRSIGSAVGRWLSRYHCRGICIVGASLLVGKIRPDAFYVFLSKEVLVRSQPIMVELSTGTKIGTFCTMQSVLQCQFYY